MNFHPSISSYLQGLSSVIPPVTIQSCTYDVHRIRASRRHQHCQRWTNNSGNSQQSPQTEPKTDGEIPSLVLQSGYRHQCPVPDILAAKSPPLMTFHDHRSQNGHQRPTNSIQEIWFTGRILGTPRSTVPTWSSVLEEQINLSDAVAGTISFCSGFKVYALNAQLAKLFVRSRGFRLDET